MTTIPTHSCYTVRPRGEDKRPYWARLGSAWLCRDGSYNIQLDSLPLDGRIVLRLRKANENDGTDELDTFA